MVVVVLTILRSQGAEAPPADTRPPDSPSAVLSHSSTLLDQALGSFRAKQGGWPQRAFTEDRALRLLSGSSTQTVDPGLDRGVHLTWYRSDSDRFAYCLSHDLRALTVVTAGEETTKREVNGACPAPDVNPDLVAN